MRNGPLVVTERPICHKETPKQCRKTAVVSIDGVWRCPEHDHDNYALQFARFRRQIVWER